MSMTCARLKSASLIEERTSVRCAFGGRASGELGECKALRLLDLRGNERGGEAALEQLQRAAAWCKALI